MEIDEKWKSLVKKLINHTNEIEALFFSDDGSALNEYGDRVIPDLEEIIVLAEELRVRYKVNNSKSKNNKNEKRRLNYGSEF